MDTKFYFHVYATIVNYIIMLMLLFATINLVSTSKTKVENCKGSQPVKVAIKDGSMIGTTMITTKGKPFCAFLGIPYAEPPIGNLRFRDPKQIKPWKGVINATVEKNSCTQPTFPKGEFKGDEDCLYLSVFTPQINGTLKSVLLRIHGGEFYFGGSRYDDAKPDYILEKDVVYVSFNYRLGTFGFLSTEDDACPGNYGMKDQITVLKWVRNNIQFFGGNPNDVTIFGESAGGASVHYHMLSPLAKGLFHKAISMEGTVFMPWARYNRPRHVAEKQARLVGCPTDSTMNLVSCLRQVPAHTIIQSIFQLFKIWFLPSPRLTPVVEKTTMQNPNPYLTGDPIQLIMNGSFHNVPWLLGSNSQSMAVFLAPVFNLKVLDDQTSEFSPSLLNEMMLPDDMDHATKISIWQKIVEYYDIHKWKAYSNNYERERKLILAATQRFFTHGVHQAALAHSLLGHKPIYKYNYAFRGRTSNTFFTTLKNYGVAHGDELRYIFKDYLGTPPYTFSEQELSELLITLLTNFAKYGNPTPKQRKTEEENSILKELEWKPIQFDANMHLRYLNIGQTESFFPSYIFPKIQHIPPLQLNMARRLLDEDMKFWDSLPLEENFKCTVCRSMKSASSIFSINLFTLLMNLTWIVAFIQSN